MRIDILHVASCPNLERMRARLAEALDLAGRTARVREVEVTSMDEAVDAALHGSPTLLVDGRDPFPAEAGRSLSCRLYRTPAGLDGAPSVDQLVAVLAG